jgi:hypothetical protein
MTQLNVVATRFDVRPPVIYITGTIFQSFFFAELGVTFSMDTELRNGIEVFEMKIRHEESVWETWEIVCEEGVNWINLAQSMVRLWAFVNTVTIVQVP